MFIPLKMVFMRYLPLELLSPIADHVSTFPRLDFRTDAVETSETSKADGPGIASWAM